MTDYEMVTGLETHVQLKTDTKLFCSCTTRFGAQPNSQTCPTCLGHPGTLPVLNGKSINLAMKAALALNCEIAKFSKFDRKHYYYPDLPKGYQISQYDIPFAHSGYVELRAKRIRIVRAHIEEDAGKLIHTAQNSLVDLNRAGIPLLEIVTYPDFRSSDEVIEYLSLLKAIMQYVGASDCKMELGELRCDVNISIRSKGTEKLGTKVEIKNLNSLSSIRDAIEYEVKHQIDVLASGGRIPQQTKKYNVEENITEVMRSKEDAPEYRYFPEPDLPLMTFTQQVIDKVKNALPELPNKKYDRFMNEYSLLDNESFILSKDKILADLFETVVRISAKKPKTIANWIINEVNKVLNDTKLESDQIKFTIGGFIELLDMVELGTITPASAKEVLKDMIVNGSSPMSVVKERDLMAIRDTQIVEESVNRALATSVKAVADYKAGKETALKYLVGQVMKATKGKIPAVEAEKLLREKLR